MHKVSNVVKLDMGETCICRRFPGTFVALRMIAIFLDNCCPHMALWSSHRAMDTLSTTLSRFEQKEKLREFRQRRPQDVSNFNATILWLGIGAEQNPKTSTMQNL